MLNPIAPEQCSFEFRLLAVLDYDGIPQRDRMKHLMSRCKLSRYMARLILSGKEPRNMKHFESIASGLSVDFIWLTFDHLGRFHPRTSRILIQQIKGYPKVVTDRCIRLFVAYKAGYPKANNLMDLVTEGKLMVEDAAQLMAA